MLSLKMILFALRAENSNLSKITDCHAQKNKSEVYLHEYSMNWNEDFSFHALDFSNIA